MIAATRLERHRVPTAWYQATSQTSTRSTTRSAMPVRSQHEVADQAVPGPRSGTAGIEAADVDMAGVAVAHPCMLPTASAPQPSSTEVWPPCRRDRGGQRA